MRIGSIVWVTVATLTCFSGSCSAQRNCSTGWFGPDCEFKCRCTLNRCTENGTCGANSVCEGGWFGFECQYADLAANKSLITELTDGNDLTCLTSQTHATVFLAEPNLFTWLRLTFKTHMMISCGNVLREPVIHEQVSIGLGQSTRTLTCNNPRNTSLDNTTLDVYCDVDGLVQVINVTGATVQHLCSLYVSGGRNLALKQPTNQTNNYSEMIGGTNFVFSSSLAVDGNRDQRFDDGHSCSSTSAVDNPRWSIMFPENLIVTRYIIFNRDVLTTRLQGFALTSFSSNGTQVYRHQDSLSTSQPVYIIVPDTAAGVARVVIELFKRSELTLCEVEVYGDKKCPVTGIGLKCELTCECPDGLPCFSSTRKCPAGCGKGHMGDRCEQICPEGRFGLNCNETCSDNCYQIAQQVRAKCHRVTGECTYGCGPGFYGPRCNTVCPTGVYGDGCGLTCSDKCLGVGKSKVTQCNRFTGVCELGCVIGYISPKCDTVCPAGTYGKDCKFNCSEHCAVIRGVNTSACDFRSGKCLYRCVNNFKGPMCMEETGFTRLGILANFVIPALAISLLVVPLIAFVVVPRRRQSIEQQLDKYHPASQGEDHEPEGHVTVGIPEIFWTSDEHTEEVEAKVDIPAPKDKAKRKKSLKKGGAAVISETPA